MTAAEAREASTGFPPQAPAGRRWEEPSEADLLARLDARGIALRPEEVAPVLATARFLARAAALVREAAGP